MSVYDVIECVVMTPEVYNAYLLSRFSENNAPGKYAVKVLTGANYSVELAATYLFDDFDSAKCFAFDFEVNVKFL